MRNQNGLGRSSKYVPPLSPLCFVHPTNSTPEIMIREQDRTIDSIAGTLNTLAQQAGLIGQEIVEHNECVPESRLGDALV